MSLTPLLQSYDHVLLDLDGCVWVANEPTPRAAEAVAALRAAGKRVAFVTNDARHAGEDFVRQLWSGGFQASLEEVVTVGGGLQHVLFERFNGAMAVVIGSRAVHRHVHDAGLRIVNDTDMISRAGVVVVAGHDRFDFEELRQAARALHAGATLVGAARDATFPGADGLMPASGAILAAVEVAGGVKAEIVVGKPEPQLFLTALDRLGPGRALMVGDRLDADVAGAHAAGIDAALVLSGVSERAHVGIDGTPQPVAVADNLGELVLG
jgi:HAD superfamily hydrolase (TIGR01450 family)